MGYLFLRHQLNIVLRRLPRQSRLRGRYRAHLPGLYLCGSSSHPGENVTGLPGYNAAQFVMGNLGTKTDWMPRPLTERFAALT